MIGLQKLDPHLLQRAHAFAFKPRGDAEILALMFELADSGCFTSAEKLKDFVALLGVRWPANDCDTHAALHARCAGAQRRLATIRSNQARQRANTHVSRRRQAM